jgi:outer membrane protein OmpA-like peptidoglycan-associated protein
MTRARLPHSTALLPAVLAIVVLLAPREASAADRCAGDLDAGRIVACLQHSRGMTIGARPAVPTANLAVRFDFGSAALTEAGMRSLEQLAEALRSEALRSARFELAGHTDAVGGDDYNLALSQRRAEAARDFLLAHGVDPAGLVVKGYGWHQLYDPDHPEAAENRRVQVTRLPP